MSDAFMNADEVAKVLGVSVSFAYKIMRDLNKELKCMGYFTIAGRVNREYFLEKLCYKKQEEK